MRRGGRAAEHRAQAYDLVVLAVRGEVDFATTPQLTKSIDAMLANSLRAVISDLTGVLFLASMGTTVLISQ